LGLTISGQEYIPLRTAASRVGLRAWVSPDAKNAALADTARSVKLEVNQRASTINGTRVWLNFPISEDNNQLYISKLDVERTLIPLLQPSSFILGRYRLRHIVIDPGHGGHDTGARNTRLRTNEKIFTLDVALRLKQRLEALGYRVTLTREDDHYVELKDRPRVANALRADLFISVHFNSAEPGISGIETYSYTPQGAPSSSRDELMEADKTFQPANANDMANLWLAYEMQKTVSADLRSPDRAARHARFVVLENLHCPGILVEAGYITSTSEGSRLTSTLYRQQVANAIADGVRAYHRKLLGMK
jgi:N-acetylmuramoyl-L-alanine amidase